MTAAAHLRWSLLVVAVFLGGGLCLEALLGFRPPGWMGDELRREFLRLGHAHGGLLAMLNLGLSWAMERLQTPEPWAVRCRIAGLLGAVLVGAGFVGGGLWHARTDPGPLVLLVPGGALMLLAAVVAIAVVGRTLQQRR